MLVCSGQISKRVLAGFDAPYTKEGQFESTRVDLEWLKHSVHAILSADRTRRSRRMQLHSSMLYSWKHQRTEGRLVTLCFSSLSLWVLLYGYLILLSVISTCPSCSLLILYCHLPWNVALPLLLTASPPLLTINWNHSPFPNALVSKLSFRQQQLLTLERPLFLKCLRWP